MLHFIRDFIAVEKGSDINTIQRRFETGFALSCAILEELPEKFGEPTQLQHDLQRSLFQAVCIPSRSEELMSSNCPEAGSSNEGDTLDSPANTVLFSPPTSTLPPSSNSRKRKLTI